MREQRDARRVLRRALRRDVPLQARARNARKSVAREEVVNALRADVPRAARVAPRAIEQERPAREPPHPDLVAVGRAAAANLIRQCEALGARVDVARARAVDEVDDLRRSVRRLLEAGGERVDSGVEDGDDDAPSVEPRVRPDERSTT